MSEPPQNSTGWTRIPSPRRGVSRRTRALAFGLPVVLIVAVGVVLIGAHMSSTSGATPKASRAPSILEDRFVLPATVAGMPLSTNPNVIAAAKTLLNQYGVSGVVGGYQSSSDPQDVFILAAIPQVVTDPATTAQSQPFPS